jgi:hypothetical protein
MLFNITAILHEPEVYLYILTQHTISQKLCNYMGKRMGLPIYLLKRITQRHPKGTCGWLQQSVSFCRTRNQTTEPTAQ